MFFIRIFHFCKFFLSPPSSPHPLQVKPKAIINNLFFFLKANTLHFQFSKGFPTQVSAGAWGRGVLPDKIGKWDTNKGQTMSAFIGSGDKFGLYPKSSGKSSLVFEGKRDFSQVLPWFPWVVSAPSSTVSQNPAVTRRDTILDFHTEAWPRQSQV